MKKPIIVVNLKTYKSGKDALRLAKDIEKVDRYIIVGAQPVDIGYLKFHTKLKIYAQHVDYFNPGRNTGFVTPESVKAHGASGTFLNHSEHKLTFDILKKTLERCKKIKLKTLVFASNLNEANKIKSLNPDYIAVEPPELVAGKISVSKARPELIKKISKSLGRNFLVGAGIHSNEDLRKAMEFGASGIAISSAITKSKNPGRVMKELIG